MRRALLLGTVAFMAAGSVGLAADLRRDMIGGPPPAPAPYKAKPDYDWGGLYAGLHAGGTSADYKGEGNLTGSLLPVSEFIPLRDIMSSSVDNKLSDQKMSYGGYVGHNWTDEDLVYGLELDYTNFGGLKGQSSNSLGRSEAAEGTNVRNLQLSTKSSFKISDAAIVKARFGQSFDRLLPYGFIGIGAAQVDYSNSASAVGFVRDTATGQIVRGDTDSKSTRKNGPVLAAAAGLGVEYAVMDNVIVRGEYMFVGLAKANNATSYLNSVRAGVAAKF